MRRGQCDIAAACCFRVHTAGRVISQRPAIFVLRMTAEDGSPDKNKTADWKLDLGAELLRAKRPKGVDDVVENIPQAPGSETLFKSYAEDERVYPGES